MLASHVNYKYQEGYKTLTYGLEAICHEMQM